jgi:hypothetical protein
LVLALQIRRYAAAEGMNGETSKALDEIVTRNNLSSTREKQFTGEEIFLRNPKPAKPGSLA